MMKSQHPITDPRPFGELASAAVAAALAMRLRGRKDDLHWAELLDKLGRRAQMYLAGQVGRKRDDQIET